VPAVRGGWTTPPLQVKIGNIIKGAKFEDKSAATAFAVPIARVLKAEALKAGIAVFGADLKPFSNKAVKVRVFDEIEYEKPTATGGGFNLYIFLKPGELWAIGQWGTYDHLIGMPKGYGSGRRTGGKAQLSAFGQLEAQRKRQRKIEKRSDRAYQTVNGKKALKAPGYAHPVKGPIFVKGMPPRGAIKYAFKRVRDVQNFHVNYAWTQYITKTILKS
jgi:hypothetical protein